MNTAVRTVRTLAVISWETFVLLRRDKVFVPALVAALLISAFANLASDWSVEDFTKILFDIGFFGFQVTGSLVAIFWGAKIISDSRQEGSLELQLSAPVSRGTWVVGKYIGLSLCLITLGIILFAIWQSLMLLNQFGWMTENQIICYLYMVLSWLVQGALAIMLASFMGQAIAMFSTLCLCLTGMSSALLATAVSPNSSESTKFIISTVARFWDFQQFNLIDFIQNNNWLGSQELAYRAAYGVLLILVQISLSVTIFSNRDVNA